MNERIRELADKAIEDMPGAWNIPDEFCEKFAELIMQECAGTFTRLIDEVYHLLDNGMCEEDIAKG